MSNIAAKKVRDFYSQPRFVNEPELSSDPIVCHEQKCRQKAIMSLINNYNLMLDVACGNGRYFNMLLGHTNQLIGVDFSPDMLKMAKSKADILADRRVNVLLGDLTQLPFIDSLFDLIVCIEVLEHVPNWERAISEFHRLLKPCGSLVISTPNKFSMYGLTRYVSRLFIKSENPYDQWKTYFRLRSVLTSAGFVITGVKGVCYLPGDLSYYRPFKGVITHLLCIARFLHNTLSGRWPFHSLGYGVVVRGKKTTPA